MRYLVEYECELAGWDEFNKSFIDHTVVVAESEEDAQKQVLNKNKGKRVYIIKVINII